MCKGLYRFLHRLKASLNTPGINSKESKLDAFNRKYLISTIPKNLKYKSSWDYIIEMGNQDFLKCSQNIHT